MKAIILFLSVCLPFSAFARSVTIEVSNELSYESIRAYPDGITFIEKPAAYDEYRLGASTKAIAADNARYFCEKLKMTAYDFKVTSLINTGKTVDFVPDANGQFTGPAFNYDSAVISTLICKQ